MIEASKITENVYVPETIDLWVNLTTLIHALGKSLRHGALEVRRPLSFNAARVRGYRAALPRSSTVDPSLSAS
jgi:hypothetical protein